MKTDLEWRKTIEERGLYLRDVHGGDACRELDAFIRAVQADARGSALKDAADACETRALERASWGATCCQGTAEVCGEDVRALNARIASTAALASGEVPLGNNPAPEVK